MVGQTAVKVVDEDHDGPDIHMVGLGLERAPERSHAAVEVARVGPDENHTAMVEGGCDLSRRVLAHARGHGRQRRAGRHHLCSPAFDVTRAPVPRMHERRNHW
jgi:hypothetical protein